MRKTGAIKVEMHLVSLRSICPSVPKDEEEKWLLVEDLARIGCEGLLIQPWSLRSEEMVQEFLQECSNKWEGTIRRDLERWTTKTWAEVYSFPKEGRGQASRTDKFVEGKFSTSINPKDGHAVANCVDPRKRSMLEFVVLILYPKKPTWIIVILANIIFGALTSVRKVSWGLVMQELVGKLVSGLEKGKPSPISPYLFHLYDRFKCLRDREMTILESARAMLEFDVTLEVEVQPDTKGKDSDRESLSSME